MNPSYTLLRPETPEMADLGLRCLMNGLDEEPRETGAAARYREQLRQFYVYCGSMGIDPRRQVMAFADGKLQAMALWIASPGHTALLFTPNLMEHPQLAPACGVCIAAAISDALANGAELVQAMVDPRDALAVSTFTAAGLEPLATLSYMERRPPLFCPVVRLPAGVSLRTYAPGAHGLFAAAIQDSYQETLDCPRLAGARNVDDVIAGHKAAAPFDPDLWALVIVDNRPAGVSLLAHVPARNSLEVVYLGLAPFARGRGIGKALMQQALACSVRRACALLSVAVDAANTPAVKLYRRAGFAQVADRLAMVHLKDQKSP